VFVEYYWAILKSFFNDFLQRPIYVFVMVILLLINITLYWKNAITICSYIISFGTTKSEMNLLVVYWWEIILAITSLHSFIVCLFCSFDNSTLGIIIMFVCPDKIGNPFSCIRLKLSSTKHNITTRKVLFFAKVCDRNLLQLRWKMANCDKFFDENLLVKMSMVTNFLCPTCRNCNRRFVTDT